MEERPNDVYEWFSGVCNDSIGLQRFEQRAKILFLLKKICRSSWSELDNVDACCLS